MRNSFILNSILKTIFLLAGFSLLSVGSVRPSDIFLLLLFVIIIIKGYLKISGIYIFFILSFCYAFLIGMASKPIAFFVEIITFTILFSLIQYFQHIEEKQIIKLLSFFNYSMFFSNATALTILLFIPQFRELVIDASSFGFRLKGFFGQANGYSLILLLNIPIAVYFVNREKSITNFIILITSFVALVFSQSRGAFLGLILSTILVYFIYAINNNPFRRLKKLVLPGLIAILIIFVIFAFLPEYLENNFGLNLSRINPLKESSSNRGITEFSVKDVQNDRLYLITAGLRTLAQYPWGLGFQDQHLIIGKVTGVYLIPHNYFVSLFLTYGVFVGLIWNIIIIYIILKGFHYLKKNKTTPRSLMFYLHIIFLSIFLYFLTHSVEWSYLYIIFSIYCSFIFQKTKRKFIEY